MAEHRFHGLATDAEYRGRWQLYHLADGKVADSRLINWRQVEWEKVVKIETFIRDNKFEIDCSDPRFQFFMVFRWHGMEGTNEKRREINVWTVGWSDGVKCFLKDIDFKTGRLLRTYVEPLMKYESHVHPRVANRTWKNRNKHKKYGTLF